MLGSQQRGPFCKGNNCSRLVHRRVWWGSSSFTPPPPPPPPPVSVSFIVQATSPTLTINAGTVTVKVKWERIVKEVSLESLLLSDYLGVNPNPELLRAEPSAGIGADDKIALM